MTPRRYRCRFCGVELNAWLPVTREPNGAMLLGHLSQLHRDEVRPYLDRMHTTEDNGPVAAEAFEVVAEESS